jgi:hypothetical protein
MGLILRQTTTPNSGTTLSVKGSTLTYAEADGNFTYLMTNMSGSRISITGPTSITGSLTVSGGITGSFSGSLAGTIAYTQGGNSFGGNSTIGLNDNYSLSINAGSSTRLFISASGNVGIGTTSPTFPLTISSSANTYIALQSATYGNYRIGTTSVGFLVYDTENSAYRMSITNSAASINQMNIFSDAKSYGNSYDASIYIGNYQTNVGSNNNAIGYRLQVTNSGSPSSDVDSIFNIQYAYDSSVGYTPPTAYSTLVSVSKTGVIITGSLTTTAGAKLGNNITDTHTITGSLSTSGSVTINNILTLTVRSTTPASQPTGSIICSGSGVDNHLYYYNGSAWRQLDN